MRKKILMILLAFMPLYAVAQVIVSGVIKDNDGVTLPFASVMEVGNPSNEVVSNEKGEFRIQIKSEKSKIAINFMGFKERIITPRASGNVVQLELDDNLLEAVEVVRIGFGTTSRISNVAAISQVNAQILQRSTSTSVQNSLAGRLPGLFQLQGGGQPGNNSAEIFIRGVSTFADVSLSPLIMIDDIESDISTLNQMTQNEIEDISILKDAASTAIFGVKGANGVILVTTKRGTEGPARVTFRADVGLKQPTYKSKFLGSYESLSLIKELHLNDGNQGALDNDRLFSDAALEHFRLGDEPYLYPDVDWYNILHKKLSLTQKYSVDIRGGTDKVSYFLNLGYLDDGGLFKDTPKADDINNSYYEKRYNIRSNFDIKVNKRFTVKLNASASLSEVNEPNLPNPRESGTFSIFRRIMGGRFSPWNYPAYNPDGTYGGMTETSVNPLALLGQGGYQRDFRNRISGNITLDHDLDFITKGLKISGVLAASNNWGWKRKLTRSNFIDYMYDYKEEYYRPVVEGNYRLAPLKVENARSNPLLQITSRINLDYKRKFGKHAVEGLVLASWTTKRIGTDKKDDNIPVNSMSISSRVAYDYDSRYLLSLSVAYNGSDKFAKDNRYDYFPSIGLGWNLSEEPYLKNRLKSIGIDFFKIRGSYGIAGSDIISGYGYQETYKKLNDYWFGTSPTKIDAWVLKALSFEDVKWEKEKQFNLGFDFGLFKNRLGGSVDFYHNRRHDILTTASSSVPLFTGLYGGVLPKMNMGIVDSKGWEGRISWSDKIGKDFRYSITATASYSKNIIEEMDETEKVYLGKRETGKRVGMLSGFVAQGFYNSQEEIDNGPYDHDRGGKPGLGDIKYKDISGPNGVPDNIIDDHDKVEIGNNRPNFIYSGNLDLSYKGFDVSVFFQGAKGATMSTESMLRIGGTDGRPAPIHRGRWTQYNDNGQRVSDPEILKEMNRDASYPILSDKNGKNQSRSTFWMRSANYLKWKSLSIGYTFPEKMFKKVGIQSLRLSFTGENLHTWSKVAKDFNVDPESTRTSQYVSTSVGPMDTYPQQRTYNFGCQIVF